MRPTDLRRECDCGAVLVRDRNVFLCADASSVGQLESNTY